MNEVRFNEEDGKHDIVAILYGGCNVLSLYTPVMKHVSSQCVSQRAGETYMMQPYLGLVGGFLIPLLLVF